MKIKKKITRKLKKGGSNIITENINNSALMYDANFEGLITNYYNYIIELIKNILKNNQLNINIMIGEQNAIFNNNNNKTCIISINYEQSLVKGNSYVKNVLHGKVSLIDNPADTYLVSLGVIDKNTKSNIIIEYSIPNIINIKTSGHYDEYSKKLVYISPCLYDFYNSKENRTLDCLTTFVNMNDRRNTLITNLINNNIKHTNVNNVFESNALKDIYYKTKVIVNIFQSNSHHTFAELRVLPALLCGVIIVSEDVPLRKKIPYHKYVIWTTFENISNKVKEVLNNYDKYYNDIFINSNIKNDIEKLCNNNYKKLHNKIIKCLT